MASRSSVVVVVVVVAALSLFVASAAAPASDNTQNLADVPCGRQLLLRRGSRIVGGENAAPGEFPWLVSIKRGGGHFCGGTIVHKRWIVTAGHCMCSGNAQISAENITVTVGEHDLAAKRSADAVDKKISRIYFHPGYRCPRFVNDIALLELSDDIFWSNAVAPACLPGVPRSYSDAEATAAGWGWLHEDRARGRRSDILQKVKLTVVDNAKCRDWYSSQGKKTKILDTQLCAGHENGGRDACWADSGGPLMVPESGGVAVVGVVSTGIGCGRPRLPGVYTRMTEYVPWIRKMVRG